MTRIADQFFLLDDPYEEISSPEKFWQIVEGREPTEIKDLLYRPNKLESPEPPKKWSIRNKDFSNFSFAQTHISLIEFTDCHFENCLFIGSTITDCRFNNCNFIACNFYRAEMKNCFVDPKAFDRCTDSAKYPNIGLGLYQELLHNSRQQVQPDFTRYAQHQFTKWKRYLDWDEIKSSGDGYLKKFLRCFPLLRALFFEVAMGSGVRLGNLALTSVLVLTFLTILNYHYRSTFGLMLGLEPVNSFPEAFYFSTIVVTSLGFGDITPTTDIGRIVVAFQAIMGFITLATLVSMIFRKVTN